MAKQTSENRILAELESDLSSELKALQPHVLQRAVDIYGGGPPLSVHSFHGIIGGKNNEYTDAVRLEFRNPNDFIARWLHGLREKSNTSEAAARIVRLLKDAAIREYVLKFLTRNFYRNIRERTRQKPDENLWSVWFGNNNMDWGLLIAPVLRDGIWVNDKSEMRRAKYSYWTVGHVLATGIVDSESNELYEFNSVAAISAFYQSVLKRCSSSIYEKAIAGRYVEYLRTSNDVEAEPFLIPELRYAGRGVDHEHRLDFAILNAHTMKLVGIEISPHSTHGAVEKAKSKTQKAINEELSKRWSDEMTKRNKYFSQFGITTVTFTDTDLKDIDSCFNEMAKLLSERPKDDYSLEEELEFFAGE